MNRVVVEGLFQERFFGYSQHLTGSLLIGRGSRDLRLIGLNEVVSVGLQRRNASHLLVEERHANDVKVFVQVRHLSTQQTQTQKTKARHSTCQAKDKAIKQQTWSRYFFCIRTRAMHLRQLEPVS